MARAHSLKKRTLYFLLKSRFQALLLLLLLLLFVFQKHIFLYFVSNEP